MSYDFMDDLLVENPIMMSLARVMNALNMNKEYFDKHEHLFMYYNNYKKTNYTYCS